MAGTPAPPPVILRVRVIDDRGQPIADASVLFNKAPVEMADIAALTDGNGEVLLAAPVPGAYTLEAAASGFAGAMVTVDVGQALGGDMTVEMAMTRSAEAD